MAPVTALYCHLPFCHTICPFCAFAVHGNRPALHAPYLAALKEEIRLCAAWIGERPQGRGRAERPDSAEAPRVAALYFGGGTPSTLPAGQIAELIQWITRHFPLAPGVEIAFELNPEDTHSEYLRGLRDAGVNRASLGLQSLHGPTLAALGRNHGPAQGRRALSALRASGPENHNLDLLFGAPGIGPGHFRNDVERVVEERPPHLSLYGLDIEEHTLFGRNPAVLRWAEGAEARQAGQYLWAAETLVARGYRHYEVSNFCLPGREGRQNLLVWDGKDYLGFGLGAHSHIGATRHHNERHLRAYLRALDAGRLPIAFREELSLEKQANEALMLSLRRDSGLNPEGWEEAFGFAWGKARQRAAERLVKEGRARFSGGRFVLTAQGFLVADAVTAELMVG